MQLFVVVLATLLLDVIANGLFITMLSDRSDETS